MGAAEAGYDLRLVLGDAGHSPNHGGVLLPDALRWVFRRYDPAGARTIGRVCQTADVTQPPRAVALVVRNGRILIMKRYYRRDIAGDCRVCGEDGRLTGPCPGHHYAVLPGGGVESGETPAMAAERELLEEAGMTGRAGELVWAATHAGRQASYFVMEDVVGEPVLGGGEADSHSPNNSFELAWADARLVHDIGMRPHEVVPQLLPLLMRQA